MKNSSFAIWRLSTSLKPSLTFDVATFTIQKKFTQIAGRWNKEGIHITYQLLSDFAAAWSAHHRSFTNLPRSRAAPSGRHHHVLNINRRNEINAHKFVSTDSRTTTNLQLTFRP
jgi:hypothetical protein